MDFSHNSFEKRWFLIFIAMYAIIMLPLPFFFSEEYIPAFKGTPLFVFGWLAHAVVTIGLIVLFACQCLARPEYKQFDKENN